MLPGFDAKALDGFTQRVMAGLGFVQSGAGARKRSVLDKLREVIDAKDFGAIDTTGVTLATSVLQLALNAGAAQGKWVRLPAGTIISGALTWPVGLPGIIGRGRGVTTLKASGTLAAFTPLINMSGVIGFDLMDMTIEVDQTVYTQSWGVQMLTCQLGLVENVTFTKSGSAAIRGSACSDVTVRDVSASNWRDSGITFPDSTGTNQRISIENCYVPGTGTQTSHNINIVSGGGHIIENCSTTNNVAGSFGANMYKATGSHIRGNTFSNGVAEGCNVQDSSYCTIIGNTVIASGSSGDFGISVFGDPAVGGNCVGVLVASNVIYSAGKSGVALAARCNNCLVIGNHIHNCNQVNAAEGAGVLMYGLGCNSNAAIGNFIFDTSAKTKYAVNEWNDGSGNPAGNFFFDNVVVGNGLTAEWNLLSTTSRVKAQKWKAYTPTVASTSGTITSYTVNSAEFKPEGDQVHVKVDVTITNNGTGAGALQVSLPATADSNGGTVMGAEIVTSGSVVRGIASGTAMNLLTYNNTYPVAATSRVVVSGSFKLA